MALKELSDGGPDGTRLGQTSTDLVAFYGKTPVVKYTTSVPVPISTAVVSISATQWGFTSSAQGASVLATLYRLAEMAGAYGLTTS